MGGTDYFWWIIAHSYCLQFLTETKNVLFLTQVTTNQVMDFEVIASHEYRQIRVESQINQMTI